MAIDDTALGYAALCAPDRTPGGITRRRFLQGAMALGAVAAIDPRLLFGERASAAPLGPNEHVLVVVFLAGGNDGLNTVCPVNDSMYRSLRGPLALDPAACLPVGGDLYLNPALTHVKARYDAGKVAIVRGLGESHDDHSHFSSMATWMSGQVGGMQTTGWLGRHLDGLGLDGLAGVSVGDSGIPLHLRGATAPVTGLPTWDGLFGVATDGNYDDYVYDALQALGSDTMTKGQWAQAMAMAMRDGLQVANTVQPAFAPGLPDAGLARDLTLAARVINLDVGARIVTATFGSFDTHDDQLTEHAALMGELDAGIEAFFAALDPAFATRVTLMTFSEFGRRVDGNDSGGTDHGTAGTQLVIGDSVLGGLHGLQPSLAALDSRGDLQHTVDFRSLYATVLADWLGGDDAAVLGGTFERLPIFKPVSGGGGLPAGVLTPLPPARVLDTRTALPAVTAGTPRSLTIAGQGGVPGAGAGTVVVNLTATQPSAASWLTLWPSGTTAPTASNLNFAAGQTRANLAIAKMGADGKVLIANGVGATHVIADVFGWFPGTGACLTSVTPARILDTRNGAGTKLGAGQPLDLKVTGVGGVPANGVGAVVLNLTATAPTASTYLTAWPSGQPRPLASNLNPAAGETVANLVLARVGAGGMVSLFNATGATHVIADVLAWLPDNDARYGAMTPYRLLDTRAGNPVGAGGTATLALPQAGVPASARAAVINVTATQPSAASWVTAYPSGTSVPSTSNLNMGPGETVPNLVIVPIGADGKVVLRNAVGTTHLIADVNGWFC